MSANLASAPTATPERILKRLEWRVVRRLDGALQGDYRTLFYGVGVDLSDLREYQPQDDIRHIDWNVTARMNTLYVRQYREDRELTSWFLLDLTRSMRFGPADRHKLSVLVDFVGTMARLLTRGGNRVGALLYDGRGVRVIPPRTGRRQVLRLIFALMAIEDGPAGASTDLGLPLRAALGVVKRRSLVFLVSDFLSAPGWPRPLTQLARRHELIAVRLWDPREVELPRAGFIFLEDAETGEQVGVDTGDPVFQANFLAATQHAAADLRTLLARASVDLHTLSTEEDLAQAIVRMAALRKKRRQ
jgi:uncharacterized protein (DUF58 family)